MGYNTQSIKTLRKDLSLPYGSPYLPETLDSIIAAFKLYSQKHTILYAHKKYYVPEFPEQTKPFVKTMLGKDNLLAKQEKYIFVGAKRGNSTYSFKTWKRINKIRKCFPQEKHSRPIFNSRYMFITLTLKQKTLLINEAWKKINSYFTNYMKQLQREFGEIFYIKTTEAHKSGYPHIHALLYFKDKHFLFKPHTSKKGKKSFRLNTYKTKQILSAGWQNHGTADIKGFKSTPQVFSYLFKYISKNTQFSDNRKGNLSLSLGWLFSRRSFTCSRNLYSRLELIVNNFPKFFNLCPPPDPYPYIIMWEIVEINPNLYLMALDYLIDLGCITNHEYY